MLLPGILNPEEENLIPQDGKLIYLPDFLATEEAKSYFKLLQEKVSWRADKIKLYGKEHDVPRLQAWYADEGKSYTYSKIKLNPLPWINPILELKQKIERKTQGHFNSVLINLYRTGEDYVAWHADDEPELGPEPLIASLSLGGVRRFQLKHRYHKEIKPISLDLAPGSLVIMSGALQENWIHRISPTKKEANPRINLTFRKIVN